MIVKGLGWTLGKGALACVLGGMMLWKVIEESGPPCGVVVHLTEFPGIVTIDGRPARAETLRDSPIVRELRPGHHVLQLWRGGRAISEEPFRLRPGEILVLTAREAR